MSGPERQQSEDRQGRRGPVALQGRAGRYADSGPGLRPWELAENPRSDQREPVLQYRHLGPGEARLGPETGRRRREQHRERERPGVGRLQARRLQRRDRPRTYTGPFIYVELADNEFYSEGQQNGRKEVLKCYSNTRFKVTRVAYNDRREIVDLVIVDRNGNVRFDMNKRVEGPPQTPQAARERRPGKHPGADQTGPQEPPGRASGDASAPGRERGRLPDLWETDHEGRTGLFPSQVWPGSLSDLSKSIVKGGGKCAEPHNQRINHHQRIAVGSQRGSRTPFLATGGQGGRLRPVLWKSANPASMCFPLDPPKEQRIRAWLDELVAAGMVGTYTSDEDGKKYLKLLSWGRHQQQRAKKSKFPLPVAFDNTCNHSNGKQVKSKSPVNENENGNENEERGTGTRPTGAAATPRGFDRFWAAYPRRVGKQDALKAWGQLNPDDALVDQIVAGVSGGRPVTSGRRTAGRLSATRPRSFAAAGGKKTIGLIRRRYAEGGRAEELR